MPTSKLLQSRINANVKSIRSSIRAKWYTLEPHHTPQLIFADTNTIAWHGEPPDCRHPYLAVTADGLLLAGPSGVERRTYVLTINGILLLPSYYCVNSATDRNIEMRPALPGRRWASYAQDDATTWLTYGLKALILVEELAKNARKTPPHARQAPIR